jgi:hypothetical protein
MQRNVTALYETQAQAERVRDALKAANLAQHVEISDQSDHGAKDHHGIGEWLRNLFGGHKDHHLYAEGLRRGHFLLTAKVDDLNETRAAEIMDTSEPVDLNLAEKSWRNDGWAPSAVEAPVTPVAASEDVPGARVRIYGFDD